MFLTKRQKSFQCENVRKEKKKFVEWQKVWNIGRMTKYFKKLLNSKIFDKQIFCGGYVIVIILDCISAAVTLKNIVSKNNTCSYYRKFILIILEYSSKT